MQNKKTKTAILFHGFPDPPKKDAAILTYLKKNHYRLLIPDWVKKGAVQPNKKLIQHQVDLIIGISLGGFLAIELAKSQPQAKLLLIATGPYFQTQIPGYNAVTKILSTEQSLALVEKIKKLKKETYRPVYKLFNRQAKLSDHEYNKRADQNLQACQKISETSYQAILKLVKNTDHSKALKNIDNQTLIFASYNDKIMPLALAQEMKQVLKNSQLEIVEELHYDVFQKKDWPVLDTFLD